MNGWFKFHRKAFENPIIMKDAETFAVWAWLLGHATFDEKRVSFGGVDRKLNKGELVTTTKFIANEFNINESKVNRILKILENEKQIEKQTTNRNTLIYIVNWEKYQSDEKQNEEQVKNERKTNEEQVKNNCKTSEKQTEDNRQTSEEQMKTIQESNKDNNIKNEEETKEIKKEKNAKKKIYYPDDEKLNQAFCDFIAMRNKIKKPMTERAITMAMNRLKELSGSDNNLAVQIVEQSIFCNWQNFYELKNKNNHQENYIQTGNSREEQFQKLMEQIRRDEENANRGC